MSGELTLESLLDAAVSLPVRRVEVPELGGHCYVRTLTGAEREAFELSFIEPQRGRKRADVHMRNYKAKLVVLCLCTEDGAALVRGGYANTQAVEKMAGHSAKVLERISSVASELNGLSDDDIEVLEGNSSSAPSGASISTLPSVSDTRQSG